MSDLLTAAAKQIKYAANEQASGDTDAALGHVLKAQGFLGRVASAIAPAPETGDADEPAEPLSSDPGIAVAQLLAQTGHPVTFNEAGETIAIDPAGVAKDADETQSRELGLLGFWGVGPGRFAGGDHTLRDTYYSNDGATPIDPDVNPWTDYLSKKGS